jgi:hypothetical protein
MRTDYHSAHYPEQPAPERHGYYSPRGVALVHDVTSGPLPGEYTRCDVFYTDPPWRSGYDEFAARVGILVPSYHDFMDALVFSIPAGIPAVVVTGKHAALHFGSDYRPFPIRLNEHDAIAYARGLEVPPGQAAEQVGRQLAATYECVGDPCCGYGNTARWFVEAGKRFVVSDLNPRCIGYISEHEKGWANVLSK